MNEFFLRVVIGGEDDADVAELERVAKIIRKISDDVALVLDIKGRA